MDIINLGHAVTEKIVTVKRLSKDNDDGTPSYIIEGTTQLDRNEIYELVNLLKFEISYRDSCLNKNVPYGATGEGLNF